MGNYVTNCTIRHIELDPLKHIYQTVYNLLNEVNELESNSHLLKMGIRQGAVLVPLLLSIYINELPNNNICLFMCAKTCIATLTNVLTHIENNLFKLIQYIDTINTLGLSATHCTN